MSSSSMRCSDGRVAVDDLLERGRIELEVPHGLGPPLGQHRHQAAPPNRGIAERQHAVQHHLDGEAHHVRVSRAEPVGKLLDASDVAGAQAQRDCLFASLCQCFNPPDSPSLGRLVPRASDAPGHGRSRSWAHGFPPDSCSVTAPTGAEPYSRHIGPGWRTLPVPATASKKRADARKPCSDGVCQRVGTHRRSGIPAFSAAAPPGSPGTTRRCRAALLEPDPRLPAERGEAAHVQQLARRAVGLGGVEDEPPVIADDLGHRARPARGWSTSSPQPTLTSSSLVVVRHQEHDRRRRGRPRAGTRGAACRCPRSTTSASPRSLGLVEACGSAPAARGEFSRSKLSPGP